VRSNRRFVGVDSRAIGADESAGGQGNHEQRKSAA
jgi:hypothetical protein